MYSSQKISTRFLPFESHVCNSMFVDDWWQSVFFFFYHLFNCI